VPESAAVSVTPLASVAPMTRRAAAAAAVTRPGRRRRPIRPVPAGVSEAWLRESGFRSTEQEASAPVLPEAMRPETTNPETLRTLPDEVWRLDAPNARRERSGIRARTRSAPSGPGSRRSLRSLRPERPPPGLGPHRPASKCSVPKCSASAGAASAEAPTGWWAEWHVGAAPDGRSEPRDRAGEWAWAARDVPDAASPRRPRRARPRCRARCRARAPQWSQGPE